MFRFAIFALCTLALADFANATCGSCGIRNKGIACVSESSFKVCQEGAAAGAVVNCPRNSYCVDSPEICSVETGLNVDIPCSQYCGTCDRKTGIACVSRTKYALCLGTSTPTFNVGECEEGYVCSTTADNEFCVSESKAQSDCALSLVGRSRTPTNICDGTNTPGRHIVDESDSKSYTYCAYAGTELVETQARCPGSTNFDVEQSLCI